MKETDSYGIIKRVQADEELRSAWEKLSEPAREMFREIDQKKRVPDILNDVMFMGGYLIRRSGLSGFQNLSVP